jgi:hypothetical protein
VLCAHTDAYLFAMAPLCLRLVVLRQARTSRLALPASQLAFIPHHKQDCDMQLA